MSVVIATGARVNRTRKRRWRRGLAWTLVAVLSLSATDAMRAQPAPPTSLEYAVKATYLYKLAPFIVWPPATFASANAPFVICVVGADPFHGFLARAVAERRYGTHPFVVRKLDALTRHSGCQIVFISHLRGAQLRRTLAAVAGQPALTVADSTIDSHVPSIIQFVIVDGHVRFDIDRQAAARHHLTISSKLLHLAVAVRD